MVFCISASASGCFVGVLGKGIWIAIAVWSSAISIFFDRVTRAMFVLDEVAVVSVNYGVEILCGGCDAESDSEGAKSSAN